MAAKKKPKRPPKRASKRATKAQAPTGHRERRQPESLRLRSLAVSLTVSDLQKSIAWYRDVLGFMVGERWEENGHVRGIQIKAGSCDLMLNQDDFAKGRDRKKGEGLRIWMSTAQDIDQIAAHVKAKGGALDSPPREMPWGDRVFALADPDGFKITFVQE